MRGRFRCPRCQVIHYSSLAMCAGGWPIYDPAKPGAFVPEHWPTRVEPDRVDQHPDRRLSPDQPL